MGNVFELFDPRRQSPVPSIESDAIGAIEDALDRTRQQVAAATSAAQILNTALTRQRQTISSTHSKRIREIAGNARALVEAFHAAQSQRRIGAAFASYLTDSGQRMTLALDALRQRGDIFLEHEAAGCPPVLVYDYEVILDGKDLPHPCNYMLLHILPPEGCTVDPARRPYIIIDPRAGHGAGIGGFKADSQVGVALQGGHPVYFVAFLRDPVPGQTIADITHAEAAFVREVIRRHPEASQPAVTGNCQGGWATMLLAATNPDLTGPIVLNGAPVSTWAGEVGVNPMRYNGGVLGGTWIPMLLGDLGAGVFDGANLVMNFELLNPSRTMFRKYTDLYRDVDQGIGKFLEFETWWGGFFLLNEPEIRWIVEQLFVGNRLVKNEAQLEPGRHVDIKAIRSPIIVFTSWGDNITPPQQALNWILDTYADVSEIRIRGQRIVYMVHDQVGHLGIFVSSQIARREHSEVASTLKTIESLAPGLYEMQIDDYAGDLMNRRFTVSFAERTLDDIRGLDDGRDDERPFAAVARWSEIQAQTYELTVRPLLNALITPSMAEAARALHPMRLGRALWSSRNPVAAQVQHAAEKTRDERVPAEAGNPFIAAERLWFDMVEQSIDLWRDQRDFAYELAFHATWSTPWMRAFGRTHEAPRTLKNMAELRALPPVQSALYNIGRGGFVEAVIRMLVLLAESRGNVRRDRLERSSRVLTQDEPFRSLGAARRAMIIHEQTLVATFAPDDAIETLPLLLTTPEERRLAVEVVQYIPGEIDEMAPHTLELLQRFRAVLDLPAATVDIEDDPLTRPEAAETVALAEEARDNAAATATKAPRRKGARKAAERSGAA